MRPDVVPPRLLPPTDANLSFDMEFVDYALALIGSPGGSRPKS